MLQHVLGEMLQLVSVESGGDAEDDPLARAVGIGTATEAPEDPALARLFPDGYTDDPEASADFRRYTEPGLRSAKHERLAIALATLGDEPHKMQLDADQAQAWLRRAQRQPAGAGGAAGRHRGPARSCISALGEDDPRLALLWVYDRLTYLQESLVQALWGGGP